MFHDKISSHEARVCTATLLALIRALHTRGLLPAQAVADQLDGMAMAATVDPQGDEVSVTAARSAARTIQLIADHVERSHPFTPRG